MCLLDEKFTPLDDDNTVQFGKNEKICLDCARRELRREVSHIGRLGRDGITHLENLLAPVPEPGPGARDPQPREDDDGGRPLRPARTAPGDGDGPAGPAAPPRGLQGGVRRYPADAGPAARGRSRAPVRERPACRSSDCERQDLHRRDGGDQELSRGPGQDALFSPARCARQPEVRAVHGAVREDCQDRPPDRREPAEPARDPEEPATGTRRQRSWSAPTKAWTT